MIRATVLIFIFLSVYSFCWAGKKQNKRDCRPEQVEEVVQGVEELKQYGTVVAGPRVMPPTRCTPFMKLMKFIPIEKRSGGSGPTRERFLGRDCNVYEWDYETGALEVYQRRGSTFEHQGERNAVHGHSTNKPAKSDRDHRFDETGYSKKPKKLCRDLQTGKLKPQDVNQRFRNRLNCL